MRINKYLAECGVCSRRAGDKLVEEGRVKVNNKVVNVGYNVKPNQTVLVDGKKVVKAANYTYILFNKPKGCLTTVSDDRGRKTVMDYIDYTRERLFPVGRLDYDSEGLLILTNDGDLAFRLTHPKNEITKTYQVKIEGSLTQDEISKLKRGVMIDGIKSKKARIKILSEDNGITKIQVKISEGRNHHIKKMFDAVGKNVVFLRRTAIEDLKIGGLGRGTFRELSEREVYYLKNL